MTNPFTQPFTVFTKDVASIPSDLGVWGYARRYLPFSDEAPEAEVVDRLQAQRAVLWVGQGCAGVTEISDENTMHVWLAGGQMESLIDMLPSLELWAESNHCMAVEVGGRAGWSRVLKDHGFVRRGDSLMRYL